MELNVSDTVTETPTPAAPTAEKPKRAKAAKPAQKAKKPGAAKPKAKAKATKGGAIAGRVCIAKGCRKTSKGPRFHYLCDEHKGSSDKRIKEWQAAAKG